MKKITLALLGAGHRGMLSYAPYVLENPHEAEFVAVAEPDPVRLEQFKQQYSIPDDRCFTDWHDLLAQPQLADAILICTQDRMHFEPTIAALKAGYHVLLEKPMSPEPAECIEMERCAREHNRILSICHVLRYTDFFATIKKLLEDGAIGRLMSIQHNENVGYWHYGHSFVRGNWRNSDLSSPMILQKSCHDMDILLWLAGADCVHISSFGTLTHFRPENAPEGAPQRCLDNCPVAETCPWYAPKLYLTGQTGWPVSVITNDTSREGVIKALQEGPYGRCVYHCDNNVVDHQVVNLEFANEVTAVFTMSAFTNDVDRTLKLMGTKGELRAAMGKNEIEITDFSTGHKQVINLSRPKGHYGHGGGDGGIMRDFLKLVRNDGQVEGLTSAATSVQSHLMAFAAEQSRLEHRVVHLQEYYQQF
ncbi:oxidoreductase family protein [Thermosporothrix hazakensis]|uniref:Oxidoreductase family protein n=1 Tax=Thermosporothrix hazakensis TaxID=644383 RepID=A0A326TZM8_THEHA|nr:Gfo/Idh/MocA family oxidoreductase [Thermosporothrix hazakensis]PZW22387.1 oxidoreductase family protein [Thermosporothrix hazakensis]GCE49141.1 oxidoreductase [Thermosporothrix hazakensis]